MMAGLVPVGGVIPFLKSYTNVQSLATQGRGEYVECNGQTLSDTDSRLNGQVIPNLNASGGGTQYFLRGATTSGGTGGADSEGIDLSSGLSVSTECAANGTDIVAVSCVCAAGCATFSTLPSYYQVVWIMRVK